MFGTTYSACSMLQVNPDTSCQSARVPVTSRDDSVRRSERYRAGSPKDLATWYEVTIASDLRALGL